VQDAQTVRPPLGACEHNPPRRIEDFRNIVLDSLYFGTVVDYEIYRLWPGLILCNTSYQSLHLNEALVM